MLLSCCVVIQAEQPRLHCLETVHIFSSISVCSVCLPCYRVASVKADFLLAGSYAYACDVYPVLFFVSGLDSLASRSAPFKQLMD